MDVFAGIVGGSLLLTILLGVIWVQNGAKFDASVSGVVASTAAFAGLLYVFVSKM
jgi:hypothetical protein